MKSDVKAIAKDAARRGARREARALLKGMRDAEKLLARARELGFERARFSFTALDGRRTWASVISSQIQFVAEWGHFTSRFMVTRDKRRIIHVSRRDVPSDVHAIEVEDFDIFLSGAEVMGARISAGSQLNIFPAFAGNHGPKGQKRGQ